MFYDTSPNDTSSATNPKNRPGVQALLQAARNREFDVVVVYDIYRVSSNAHIFLDVIKELNQMGIDLSCATEMLDTRTQKGQMIVANLFACTDRNTEGAGSRHEVGSATTK